jgi:NADH-quinone oxidoreductase subunit N
MYFDDPAPAYAETGDVPQSVLIVLAALFVSPLGYLAIPYLGRVADNAASALF